MSRYIRPQVTGATVFFTVCLADRRSGLLVAQIDLLRDAVQKTKAAHPFEIVAWVTLPDHIHCIWRLPVEDRAFGLRWASIKGRFTRAVRRPGLGPARNLPKALPAVRSGQYAGVNPGLRADRGECAIWQRRFWEHHIRDERDLRHHIEYCWHNPVKHGWVNRPGDWPYSSFQRDLAMGTGPAAMP